MERERYRMNGMEWFTSTNGPDEYQAARLEALAEWGKDTLGWSKIAGKNTAAKFLVQEGLKQHEADLLPYYNGKLVGEQATAELKRRQEAGE